MKQRPVTLVLPSLYSELQGECSGTYCANFAGVGLSGSDCDWD